MKQGLLRYNSGFSLLEVMIVVTIIAAVVTMVVPRISNQNNQLKAEVRRLTTLSKQLHAMAKLKNLTYRLVIDMGEDNTDTAHSYWVESSSSRILLDDKSSIGERPQQQSEDEEPEAKPAGGFAPAVDVMKKPRELPDVLKFEDVEVISQEDPISSGLVYVHYFPQGLVEEAAIHLRTEKDHRWSLIVHPLTGRMDITTSYLSLKEVKKQ